MKVRGYLIIFLQAEVNKSVWYLLEIWYCALCLKNKFSWLGLQQFLLDMTISGDKTHKKRKVLQELGHCEWVLHQVLSENRSVPSVIFLHSESPAVTMETRVSFVWKCSLDLFFQKKDTVHVDN